MHTLYSGMKCNMPAPHTPTASNEAMEIYMRNVIVGVLCDFAGVDGSQPCGEQNIAHATMKRVVENLLENHQTFSSNIINLGLETDLNNMSFVGKVGNIVFSEDINWGRVASMVAFGVVVCQHLKENVRNHSVIESVGHEITTCLLKHQSQWLIENNTWYGFVEFFSHKMVNPVIVPRILHTVALGVGGCLFLAWISV